MQKIKTPPSLGELRLFALILFSGFFIFGYAIPAYKGREFHHGLIILAFIIMLTGIVAPKLLNKPREYWINVGNVLGRINSTILFTIIYFLIFTTIGIIFKLIKRDRLFTKFRSVTSTLVLKKEISSFTDPF